MIPKHTYYDNITSQMQGRPKDARGLMLFSVKLAVCYCVYLSSQEIRVDNSRLGSVSAEPHWEQLTQLA